MTEARKQPDDRLRLTRLARGLSQGDLALTAGVTRQAISGIESGRWSPSLDVAMMLARALDSTVEGLFGTPADYAPIQSRLAVAADRRNAVAPVANRMLLAEIAGDTVAFPLAGDHAMMTGFVPALATSPMPTNGNGAHAASIADASATAEPAQRPARPTRSTRSTRAKAGRRADIASIETRRLAAPIPTLAIAGCDPALALLRLPLQRHDPPVHLAWWSTCNARALEMLEVGAVHAASVHRQVGSKPAGRPGTEVVGFASWREGLALAPRYADQVNDLADAVDHGLRFANRDEGSEARRLLDAELDRLGISHGNVQGYDTEVRSHLLAASAIASGLADAAVICEPAAIAYGLSFLPWQDEISELYISRALLGSIEIKALLDVLAGRELPAQLAAVQGYDPELCGRIQAA